MEKEILKQLRELGFTGETVEEAIIFCEDKANDYWVDCPVPMRTTIERCSALVARLFQGFAKELRKTLKQ
jgi:hypothetical protein